jgi:hypothetical protein
MHLIYGQSHCVSWLGVESESEFDMQSVLPIIRWLSEAEIHLQAHGLSLVWDNLDDHIQQKSAYGVMSLHQIPWAKLLRCLDRDIFERLWCVQEILLARSNDIRTSKCHIDIAVLAGSSFIIARVLHDLRATSRDANAISRSSGTPYSDIGRLVTISSRISTMLVTAPLPCLEFKEARSVTPVTALSIIYENSVRECSDPRDHVYGLAALCNLGTSYEISYSQLSPTASEVFADFTLHSLRTTGSLEPFQLACRRAVLRENSRMDIASSWRHRSWTPGLPTWYVNEGHDPTSRSRFRLRNGLLAAWRAK